MKSKKIEERNVQSWLGDSPARDKQRAYSLWLQYLKPHTEQWVLDNKTSEDWGSHLCDFRDWLGKQPLTRGRGFLGDNTTKQISNRIRGYLRHVGCTLQLTREQRESLTKVESMSRLDFPFNIRVKEKLLSVCDATEEYIVSCGVSFGLRISDFKLLTRGQLEPLMDNETPIAIGKIPTQKKGVFAHPYISDDAKQAIQRLLKEMDTLGRTEPNEPMLREDANQINKILQALFKKAKIDSGSYVVRFHILRKFVSDALASVSSSDKWKNVVGKIAKSPYVSSEATESFKQAMKLIDCNGERIRGNSNKEIEAMQTTIRQQERLIISLQTRINELQTMVKTSVENIGTIQKRIAILENQATKKQTEKMKFR